MYECTPGRATNPSDGSKSLPTREVLGHRVPQIVRVVDGRAVGRRIRPEPVAPHRDAPDAEQEVLVALQARRLIRGVSAQQPTPRPSSRVASRGDEADGRLGEHVLLEAHDAHRGRGHEAVDSPRVHDLRAEVRTRHAPVHLAARENRHLGARDEPHASAVVGQQRFAESKAEGEDVGPLQEERALLREEQREARQVGAARVHLGLGEVGVDGQRAEQVRAEPLRDVHARLKRPIDVGVRRRDAAARCDGRPDRQAQAQVESRQASQFAGAARLRHLVVPAPAGPAVRLLQALDAALDVEVPGGQSRLEAQRRNWDADFQHPAAGVPARRRLPQPVPVRVLALAAGVHQRVVARAAGIHGEDVPRAPVPKGVEHDLHVIFVLQRPVARLGERHDAGRFGILAANPDQQRLRIGQDSHRRSRRRRGARRRLAHREVLDCLRLLPRRLVESAVEANRAGDRAGRDRGVRRCGCRRLQRAGPGRPRLGGRANRRHEREGPSQARPATRTGVCGHARMGSGGATAARVRPVQTRRQSTTTVSGNAAARVEWASQVRLPEVTCRNR